MKKWLTYILAELIKFFGLSGTWITFCAFVILIYYVFFEVRNIDISTLTSIFTMYLFLATIDNLERNKK